MIRLIDSKLIFYQPEWCSVTQDTYYPNGYYPVDYELGREIGIGLQLALTSELGNKLVHGSGYSPVYKRRIDHAWTRDVAWTRELKNQYPGGGRLSFSSEERFADSLLARVGNCAFSKEKFYEISKPRIDAEYSPFEAVIMALRTGTYGPWNEKQRAFLKSERCQKARKSYLQELKAECEKLKPREFLPSGYKVVDLASLTPAELKRAARSVYLSSLRRLFRCWIKYLRVNCSIIYWYIRRGRLPFVKIDRSIHLRPSHIEKWLEQEK